MDAIQFISSVNKISILAFLITVGFLVYEFLQLSKERHKKDKPVIPQFDPSSTTPQVATKTIASQSTTSSRVSHHLLVVLLIIMVLLLGGFSLYSAFGGTTIVTPQAESKVEVQEVRSKGIRYFTETWQEIKPANLSELQPGQTIFCAIETIPGTDVDKARIRVNRQLWAENDVTTQFNNSYNVFYIPYTIASDESRLKVEAQLHSAKDGWLGE